MRILVIADRELRAMLGTPLGGAVLTGWLLLSGATWYLVVSSYSAASAEAASTGAALNMSDSLLGGWFGTMEVLLLLLAPALSMRLFSEELKQHTMELLLTAPVSTAEIVLGKYLGAMGFVLIMFGCTFYVPATVYWASSHVDPAPIVGGYVGLTLLCAALVAMGMFFSSMTRSQLVALVAAFASGFVLLLLGATAEPGTYPAQLDLLSHTMGFFQGAVRLSDVSFFALFVGFFLLATHQRVESSRWV